jgi:class 3 adenylate cyclase
MFVDVIDSTSIARRLGDVAFKTKLRAFAYHIRNVVKTGYRPLHLSFQGESCLCVLSKQDSDASRALKCAIGIKRTVHEFLREFELGIGIHVGSFSLSRGPEGTVELVAGSDINLTKRIETASRTGRFTKVFISEALFLELSTMCKRALDAYFNCTFHHDLKGFQDTTLKLYELMQLDYDGAGGADSTLIELGKFFPEQVILAYRVISEHIVGLANRNPDEEGR